MNSVITFLGMLLEKVVGSLATFFFGRFYERSKNVEKHNKVLRDSVGDSDAALADKLRKRAARKNKD